MKGTARRRAVVSSQEMSANMYEPDPGDAKPPVFEPMEMSTAEMMLREAKEILDGLGIVFFLRHGTCLGAVRDHALIEWDDDIDIGSIIGLHGLTEEAINLAAEAFRARGYDVSISETDEQLVVDLNRPGAPMGWTCHRIIDDNIYQWPGLPIPVSLHVNLKRIDFLGENFNVPNPPEEYLRLKYGPEWMIPKRTDFEQDILNLMPDAGSSGGLGKIMQLMKRLLQRDTGSLKVLDVDNRPVEGAEVVLASTALRAGLVRSSTGQDGRTKFDLPSKDFYAITVRYGDHEEVLYSETLEPGVDYVYMPDPEVPSLRFNVLATYHQASKVQD
jgi:hypothetical protein